ncbi:MAG: phage baseplate assembly protein V [Aeromonas sp.]
MADLLTGKHRAQVANVNHPLKHYKAQVWVLGRDEGLPLEALPWAECVAPLGGRVNSGIALPVEVGDFVWVEFVGGDSRSPLIVGSCLYAPGGEPNLPHEALAGSDCYQHKRTALQPTPPAPEYHQNPVFSLYGTLIEIEKKGGFRLTHKMSGSAVEITKDGAVVIHGSTALYLSSEDDALVEVGGNLKFAVKGDTELAATGVLKMSGTGGVEVSGPSFNWVKS